MSLLSLTPSPLLSPFEMANELRLPLQFFGSKYAWYRLVESLIEPLLTAAEDAVPVSPRIFLKASDSWSFSFSALVTRK